MTRKIAIAVVVLLVLGALGASGYFYNQYQKTKKELQTIKTDPSTVQKAAQQEVKNLVSEVGKVIALPQGEEPTVATITDVEKLKDQPFFSKAKNGDKVLIYTNAKKAYLYDPKDKRIIDVAPINIGSSSATLSSPAATPAPAKVVLRNGTTTTGLTSKIEESLKKANLGVAVTAKENASKSDFEKSVLVVINDKVKSEAEKVAKALNIPVGNLPEGENKPNADILIIVGTDQN